MSKNIFLFTRFEGNTGGDETFLKMIAYSLAQNPNAENMDVFIQCDESSIQRARELKGKLVNLVATGRGGINIDVFTRLMEDHEFPSSLNIALSPPPDPIPAKDVDFWISVNSSIKRADLFVVAGWAHDQDKNDAQYIIHNITKEDVKVLLCCPPGANLYELKNQGVIDRRLEQKQAIERLQNLQKANTREIDTQVDKISKAKSLIHNFEKQIEANRKKIVENKERIDEMKSPNHGNQMEESFQGKMENEIKEIEQKNNILEKNIQKFKDEIEKREQKILELHDKNRKLDLETHRLDEVHIDLELSLFAKELQKGYKGEVYYLQPDFYPSSGFPLLNPLSADKIAEPNHRHAWLEHLKKADPSLLDNFELSDDSQARGDKNLIVIYCSRDDPNSSVDDFLDEIANIKDCRVVLVGAEKGSGAYKKWGKKCENYAFKSMHTLPRTDNTNILMRGLRDAEHCMATGSFSILEALHCGIYNCKYLAPRHMTDSFKKGLNEIYEVFKNSKSDEPMNEKQRALVETLNATFGQGQKILAQLSCLLQTEAELTLLSPDQARLSKEPAMQRIQDRDEEKRSILAHEESISSLEDKSREFKQEYQAQKVLAASSKTMAVSISSSSLSKGDADNDKNTFSL